MSFKTLLKKATLPVIALVAVIGGFSISAKPFVKADATSNEWVVATSTYVPIHASVLGEYGYSRTVIGFSTVTQMASFDRIKVTVSWHTYKNGWDQFWKINPIENIQDFNILGTDTTVFEDKSRDVITTLPSIGTTASYEAANARYFMNPYQILNDTYSDFLQRTYYVVIPVAYSYYHIFISGAGQTIEGQYINDGTNEGGFYEDSLGYYIDFDTSNPYIHFSDTTIINYIKVSNYGGVGTLKVQFGDYDYDENVLSLITGTFSFTGSQHVNVTNLTVNPRTEAYLSSVGIAYGNVRIGYSSETPAVIYNFRDPEGNLPDPIIVEAEDNFLSWIKDLIEQMFGDLFREVMVTLRIIGFIAIGTVVVFMIIIPILKSYRQRKQIDRAIDKSLAKQRGKYV